MILRGKAKTEKGERERDREKERERREKGEERNRKKETDPVQVETQPVDQVLCNAPPRVGLVGRNTTPWKQIPLRLKGGRNRGKASL